ncbi:MAG: LPS-assembly protein LptD, partial [Nitrospirales bacterium]|nr:LPS-assembly protein LptD [Nitrospirales bacterium]
MKKQKSEVRSQKSDWDQIKGRSLSSVICPLSSVLCLLSSVICLLSSVSGAATITADSLEYVAQDDTYVASGNVRIEDEEAIITADRAKLHQETSLAEAEGNVVYEDLKTRAETDRAEMDLKKKTGKLHDAIIFVKKGHYWIFGEGFEKLGEEHYRAKKASFTTCDSTSESNPDWCFRGNEVDMVLGEKFSARNVTYRIKGLPLLYSPYLWAPVQSERSSGFLVPLIGNSTNKGFRFNPSYYWAIDDNMDATVSLDYYSKRGLGVGAEYRYTALNNRGATYSNLGAMEAALKYHEQ